MTLRILKNRVSGDIVYYTGNHVERTEEQGFKVIGVFTGRDFGPDNSENKMLSYRKWLSARKIIYSKMRGIE